MFVIFAESVRILSNVSHIHDLWNISFTMYIKQETKIKPLWHFLRTVFITLFIANRKECCCYNVVARGLHTAKLTITMWRYCACACVCRVAIVEKRKKAVSREMLKEVHERSE